MLEGLPIAIFTDIGPVGLLAITVWMLFTGRLVTRREHEDTKADRDLWRTAYIESQKQKHDLMETGKVARSLLRALPVPQTGEADDS